MNKKLNKHRAFTLAEVLTTMGIIGIVAAMTIPNLLVQHRERENVTKLKTVYSTITQAYTRATTEFGSPEAWGMTAANSPEGAENINRILSPYFNVTQNCHTNGGCWYDGILTGINKERSGINIGTDSSFSTFSTVDGVQFAFNVEEPECKGVFGTTRGLQNVCATFTVDVNGKKFPNQYGYDIFKFYITKFGVHPYGLPEDTNFSFEDTCSPDTMGYGCTAWAVFKSNMDYLHCGGLSWSGKDRCKPFDNNRYDYDL